MGLSMVLRGVINGVTWVTLFIYMGCMWFSIGLHDVIDWAALGYRWGCMRLSMGLHRVFDGVACSFDGVAGFFR